MSHIHKNSLLFVFVFVLLQSVLPAQSISVPSSSDSYLDTKNEHLYKVKVEQRQFRTKSGALRKYTIYIPQSTNSADKSFPLIVFIHGFFMTGFQHSNNAMYFAQRGFVALTPDLTKILLGDSTRTENVRDVLDEIAWLKKQSTIEQSSLYGLIDPNRIGIAGTSAGGAVCLEMLLEAQKRGLPIQAMCSLDGVPWDRTWDNMAKLKRVNILSLRAEPALCNYHARMLGYLSLLQFPFDDVKINGARHCDTENPSTVGCKCVCGASDNTHRYIFQRLNYLYFRDKFHAPVFENPNETFVSIVQNMEHSGKVLADLCQSQPTAIASVRTP